MGFEKISGKRFQLSPENFAKERISAVKQTIEEMRRSNPEVLSLCMFGSIVRGNPRQDSDIDGYLYVDATNSQKLLEPEDFKTSGATFFTEKVRIRYVDSFVERMKNKTGMTEEQLRMGIKIRPINREIVARQIDYVRGEIKERKEYENAVEKWIHSFEGDKPQSPSGGGSITLAGMFHLETGGGIKPYRDQVIQTLSAMGPEGEEIWKEIIQYTEEMENYLQLTDKRYPRTLADARKVYRVEDI